MHLIPTQDEVVAVLRETGALRDGHYEYPTGMHSDEYLQVPLALRYYQHQRMLSVGLSRLLRANPEIRAGVRDLSIVTPMTGGLGPGPLIGILSRKGCPYSTVKLYRHCSERRWILCISYFQVILL